LSGGNRNDILQLIPLLDAVPAVADDHEHYLVELRRRGIKTVVARRYQPHGSGLGRLRWVVERTFAWLHNLKRLLVRYERRADMHEAFLALGCCLVCFRRLRSSM
jgi:transposase